MSLREPNRNVPETAKKPKKVHSVPNYRNFSLYHLVCGNQILAVFSSENTRIGQQLFTFFQLPQSLSCIVYDAIAKKSIVPELEYIRREWEKVKAFKLELSTMIDTRRRHQLIRVDVRSIRFVSQTDKQSQACFDSALFLSRDILKVGEMSRRSITVSQFLGRDKCVATECHHFVFL